MENTYPVLKTDGLCKKIGRRTIVSDISLTLAPGEIFGFLGPNGAGKTTTIRMIVGLSRITAGNIYIGGHSVRHEFRAAMREVGCIVENPELYKYMSGLDNLRLFARMYPGVDEARIAEIVRMVGLEDAIRNKVKTYSLGMKQRLGIGAALLHRPRLLILDEPTNGLDPAGIREIRGLLRDLAAKDKLTVFVSSHILGEMQQMCDRVGIINKGRMVTVKTVDELIGMTSTDRASLLVRTGDNEKALALLAQAGMEARLLGDGIHVTLGSAQVPQVPALLTAGGVAIYGMDRQDAVSLEDVFMKLTGEGK